MQKLNVIILCSILFAACTPGGTTTPANLTAEATVPVPSATQAAATPLAIAVIPLNLDQETANMYQTTIYNLTQEEGFRFQTRSSLTDADVQNETGLKIVIAFPPDPGLTALAVAAPAVQFLAVDISDLSPGSNLSIIGGDGIKAIRQAFVAGYISAMLSPDYRVGLITQDSEAGLVSIQAFTNGREYFCGTCLASFPPWPPEYQYPVHPQIPLDTPLSQYPAWSDYLYDRLVDVTYVDPLVVTPELLEYMAQNGMDLIGEELLYDDLRANWVASIQADITPAIQILWPDLIGGEGGQTIAIPLKLTDINSDLLSEGKQRLVDELLQDLQSGLVSTGVEP